MANGLAVEPPGNGSFSAHLRSLISQSAPGLPSRNESFRSAIIDISENPKNTSEGSQRTKIGPETQALLIERDALWREHERAQILFIQERNGLVLNDLHIEIEKLQNRCRDLSAALCGNLDRDYVAESEARAITMVATDEPKAQLEQTTNELIALKETDQRKSQKIAMLEEKLRQSEERSRDEMIRNSLKIKDLTLELGSKASLVSQLSSQLHQVRLKEAVERQRVESATHSQQNRNPTSMESAPSGGGFWKQRSGAWRPSPLSPSAISVSVRPPRRSVSLSSNSSFGEISGIRSHSIRVSSGGSGFSQGSWRSGDSSIVLPPILGTNDKARKFQTTDEVGNIEKPMGSSSSSSTGSFQRSSPFRRSMEFQAKRRAFEEEK